MNEKSYVAGVHYLVKALDGLTFPVDKADLISRFGDRVVRIGREEHKSVRELVEPTGIDRFETAASLHNAIIAFLPGPTPGC